MRHIDKYELRKIQTAANMKLKYLRQDMKCKSFIPNRGQENAIKVYMKNNGTKRGIPFIQVFSGGNGVGKTTMMVNFAAGLAWGRDVLNGFFKYYYVFRKFENIRKREKRAIKIRILCHAEGMKETGAVKSEIDKWFPKSEKYNYDIKKGGKNYYSEVKCFKVEGKERKLQAVIEVKTFDMSVVSHAGNNIDAILCDEPPPEEIYTENVGRLRGGGFMAFFLTPLNVAGWMIDQILNDIDGVEKTFTNASLWDNVKDGLGMKGTRGHLEKDNVLGLIREWKRSKPHEVEARVLGKFTHLKGSIYKHFKREVHVIPDDEFAFMDKYPVTMVIDPHDSRPPAVQWVVQTPLHDIVWANWPEEDYTKIDSNFYTIEQQCEEFHRIEQELFGRKSDRRICDPNKINYNYPNTNLTVAEEYGQYGIELEPSDDNLEIGHIRVNQMMYYDKKAPVSSQNRPKLLWRECAENSHKAIMNYGFKKGAENARNLSGKLDQEFKDFADLTRYYAILWEVYEPSSQGDSNFVNKVKGSRNF